MKRARKPLPKVGIEAPAAPKGKVYLHVEVLQNGASLLAVQQPMHRRGQLYLTSHGSGPFVIPHYPFSDGRLDFLRFTHHGVELDLDHQWEGFCTSKGELLTLKRMVRGRHQVAMQRGDYASVSEGDLRIMIKLAPYQEPTVEKRLYTDPAYRQRLLRHLFPSPAVMQSSLIGLAISAVVIGGAVSGLLLRSFERPTQMSDVATAYVMPFISPEHLRTAPEALQEHLDRRHPVTSVLAFYKAFSETMMGWNLERQPLMASASTDLYQQLHAEAQKSLADKDDQQREVDHLQSLKEGVSLLAIPSVLGESMNGSMLRVIDKINIAQQGYRVDLESKRQIKTTFPADPDYSWEDYRNAKRQDPEIAKALSEIHVFKLVSDEDMMYAEAAALGQQAQRTQRKTLRQGRSHNNLLDHYLEPIAMPEAARFATFVQQDLRLADEKLYQLQGSEYGVQSHSAPKPKEPLIGELEPPLIEKYIKENRYQLQLCYEIALRRNEQAAGTMEWKWRIDPRGTIADAQLITSSIQDPRMTECIRQKIMTWRFPRPRHGSVEVSFPFEFAPTKG